MDSEGRVYQLEEPVSLRRLKYLSPINRALTPEEKETGKIGFNAPCVCGSGRKFKRCCYGKSPEARKRAALPQDAGHESPNPKG